MLFQFPQNFKLFGLADDISRLDQILGKQGSKAKDVYASKISLASRVVKVERSVSNAMQISTKITFPLTTNIILTFYNLFPDAGGRHRGEIRYFN